MGIKRSTSSHGRLNPGKLPRYALDRALVEHQSWSESSKEETDISPKRCFLILPFRSLVTTPITLPGSLNLSGNLRTTITTLMYKVNLGGDEIFPPVQTGPGAHPASCKMGTGSFPGLNCGLDVLLTTHPLLVPRSWKSRVIPLPTLWATPGL